MSNDLDISILSLADSDDIAISDVELITSYSWLDESFPTIAVPGMPAKWLGRKDTPVLQPDSLTRYLDHNAAYCPHSPLEPGFRAVLETHPSFDFTGLDLITDRYALSVLLGRACGKQNAFQFGAQVLDDTVVFVRSDPVLPQVITEFRGFRKDFGEKYLRYHGAFKNTLGHYRIVTYNIGDLKIMLRYAVDGYLPDYVDNLAEPASDDVPHNGKEANQATTSTLNIKPAGVLIPHSAILELNTSNKFSKWDRIEDKFREAWLSQCHHFAIAKYSVPRTMLFVKDFRDKRGVFHPEDITLYDKTGIMEQAGLDDQSVVKSFYKTLQHLLRDVREAAANGQEDKFLIRCADDAEVWVVEQNGEIPALSKELCERLKMTSQ